MDVVVDIDGAGAGAGDVLVGETVETLKTQMAAMQAAIEGQSSSSFFRPNLLVGFRTRTSLTLSRDLNDIANFTAGQTQKNCWQLHYSSRGQRLHGFTQCQRRQEIIMAV